MPVLPVISVGMVVHKRSLLTTAPLLIGIAVSLLALRELKINNAVAAVVFGVWVLSPYITLLFFSRAMYRLRAVRVTATWLVLVSAIALLIDAFFLNPDAQSGIAVLMLPAAQYLIAIVLLVVDRIKAASPP